MALAYVDDYTAAESGEKVTAYQYPTVSGGLPPEPTQTAISAPGSITEPDSGTVPIYMDPGQVLDPVAAPPPIVPEATCMTCKPLATSSPIPGANIGQPMTGPGTTTAKTTAAATDSGCPCTKSPGALPWWGWLLLGAIGMRLVR
jgi:hypothetical protein